VNQVVEVVDASIDKNIPRSGCSRCHEVYYWLAKPGVEINRDTVPLMDRICKCGNIMKLPEGYQVDSNTGVR
jgi:RNase P subunit RPR2